MMCSKIQTGEGIKKHALVFKLHISHALVWCSFTFCNQYNRGTSISKFGSPNI